MFLEIENQKYCPYCGQVVNGDACNCQDAVNAAAIDEEIKHWESQKRSADSRIAELRASYPEEKYTTATVTTIVSIYGGE